METNRQAGTGTRRRSRWFVALLVGVAILIGGAAKILWVAERIRENQGGVLYRSAWGYAVNAYGLLVWFAVGAAIIVAVCILNWREKRQERDFERKYGPRRP